MITAGESATKPSVANDTDSAIRVAKRHTQGRKRGPS
jgi:hypothetical protein